MKIHTRRVNVLSFFCIVIVTSCGPIDHTYMQSSGFSDETNVSARLYDISTGEVLNVAFKFKGELQGEIFFILNGWEVFKGEYQTVTGGSSTWGSVYGKVWAGAFSVGHRTNFSYETRPNEYFGSAIATSDKGRVIQCEYITNRSELEPHGQGACNDNKNKVYKLMF